MKLKIIILLSGLPIFGNESSLFFPIFRNKKRFFTYTNIDLKFVYNHRDLEQNEADVLIISSWYFGRKLNLWQRDPNKVQEVLNSLRVNFRKIVWFDISDSTGTTQFPVLDFVDGYWKSQLLANLDDYKLPSKTGRIFTDFYSTLYGIEDEDKIEDHLVTGYVPHHKDKISLAWNTGVGLFGRFAPILEKINRWFPSNVDLRKYPNSVKSANDDRHNFLSCRFGLKYNRKSVAIGREKTAENLRKYVKTDKLNRHKYFQEMEYSRLAISPFGLGEITLRDFEVFICGAALMKPSMKHMVTWPNFYDEELIYQYDWDFSNLEEQLDIAKSNKSQTYEKAYAAQENYVHYTINDKTGEIFINRFNDLVKNIR